jgi:threonine/homoserine/homoserine lactone efflux protein
MFLALVFGFSFGFVGSMPLAGPIAVLVLMSGLRGAMRSGMAIAIGAAIAEAAYAFFAYWGMGELIARFPVLAIASRALAALFLLALGVYFLLQKDALVSKAEAPRERLHGSFALGLGITALNPTFLATWSAAVTVLHSMQLVPRSLAAAAPFALGVALGIVGWFWLMLLGIRRWRDRFQPTTIRRALQLVGVVLLASGVWAAVTFVQALAL